MAIDKSQQTILITGASGFLATQVVHAFLDAGYRVKGTVRSESSAEKVRKIHAHHATKDNLTFAIVPDIRDKGAFDEAVKDVDGVIHTASPFVMQVKDNEHDLLIPAIEGTKSVVEAVAKNAPHVKRIVVTSSFASQFDPSKPSDYNYTEKDWNPTTYDQAKTADGGVAYMTSKVLAEKTAFDFVKNNKPKFDVATICPPMIYGPVEQMPASMEKLNTSASDVYRFMNGSQKEVGETPFPVFVDVRDVAQAHLRAYELPEAGGQRFGVSGGNFFNQDVCATLRENFPELKNKIPDPAKEPLKNKTVYSLSNEKAQKVLGIKFRSFEETIVDTAKSLIALEKELKH